VLLAAVVALGCSRLDVITRIGEALGLAGAVDDLGGSDGVTITEGRVVIDPSIVPVPTMERAALETAGRAAARHLVDADELEEVGRLAIVAGLPDALQTAVRRALRTEPPRVPASVLRTWRDAGLLEADDPHQGWVEAACAAAAAEPLPELLDRYEAVRAGFEAAGDVEAEIAVGMGAAVIARRADDFGTLIRLIGRGSQLVAAGHEVAIPPVVLGDALGHQLTGDHEAALAALDRFPADWLEGEWAAQVLMIRGTNLLLLDRTEDAIEAFEAATGYGTTWTYAVALELLGTARWNAGDRVGAIEDVRRSEELAREIGAGQHAALACAHLAVLEAADERPEATSTARRAQPPGGSAPNEEVDRLLAIAAVLRTAGAGDDAAAARAAAALDVPTRALRSAHWTAALRTALLPGSDAELAALAAAHPSLRQALVAGELGREHLTSTVPAPATARRLLPARWCEPEPPTVEVRLLGAPTVRHDGRDIAHPDWERARVRELCLHLALITTSARDQVAARLWPDLARDAANRNLRVTLSYLLNVLDPGRPKGTASSLVDDAAGTLSLSSSLRLRIDVRQTSRWADEIRAGAASGDASTVVRAARRLVRVPGGDLLGGGSASEWIERADEARGEQVLRASLTGGPVLLRSGHPALAEAIAQRGLVEDPWAERLHQVVVRARLARDDLDAARRALRRALRSLDDLGVQPEPTTIELARLVGIDPTATR
jgi:DNA-binding SARP family transcriptional activator